MLVRQLPLFKLSKLILTASLSVIIIVYSGNLLPVLLYIA